MHTLKLDARGAEVKKLQEKLKQALLDDDMRAARRAVNGGSHGLDRFTDAFRRSSALIG